MEINSLAHLRSYLCLILIGFFYSCSPHIEAKFSKTGLFILDSIFISKNDPINVELVENITLDLGDEIDLYSLALDNESYTNVPVKWSLINNIGNLTVMEGGKMAKFSATSPSIGYIQIEHENETKKIKINIIDTRATEIRITNTISDFNNDESTNINIEFLDAQGNITTYFNDEVTLSIENDPSSRNAVFLSTGQTTMKTNAINGVVNFGDFLIDQPGNGYVLKASADGLSQATTNSFNISGSTKVFRSVGFNSTIPITTSGGSELSVSEKRAEFSNDLPDNVGVGDVIQYDANGDNLIDSIAIIQRRISSRVFVLHQPNYSMPNSVESDVDWSICRMSTSLGDAEDLIENTTCLDSSLATKDIDTDVGGRDIATANEQWNIAFYADAAHTSTIRNDDGWATSSNNYLRFFTPKETYEVGISQRHSGVWDSSKANIDFNDYYGAFFDLGHLYYRIEGFQINSRRLASGDGGGMRIYPGFVYNDPGEIHIVDNIISKQAVGTDDSSSVGISLLGGTLGTKVIVANNIIYGFKIGFEKRSTTDNLELILYNNTIGDFTDKAFSIGRYGTNDRYVIRNNIVENLNRTGTDWSYSSGAGLGDIYEFNHSTDGTVIGSDNQLGDIDFLNAAGNDYRLQSIDILAKDTGADLRNDTDFKIDRDIKDKNIENIFHMGAHAY